MVEKQHFKSLTGIRAIAAFMVFFHHYNPSNKDSLLGKIMYNFFNEFHIGVTVFFVLSGFLITYRYYEEENLNLKRYFINRFSRIYPIYFILTTLTFLFFYLTNNVFSIKEYFYNITFIRGFFDDLKFTGIAQGWSLTVEETFYFVAPILFLIVKKNKFSLVILPVLFISFGLLLVSFSDTFFFDGFMKTNYFLFTYTFFGRCIEFFAGMVLALYLMKGKPKPIFKFTNFGIVFIFLTLVVLSIINKDQHDMYSSILINNLLLPIVGIVPLFYGLISEKSYFRAILETKFFQITGKSSYIFYLIHLGFTINVLNKISTNKLFHFTSLVLISIVLYFFIERPLNKYFRKSSTTKL